MKILAKQFGAAPKAEAIALALFEKEDIAKNPLFRLLPNNVQALVKKFISGGGFSGKESETKVLPIFETSLKKIILLGRGDKQKWHRRKALLIPRRVIQTAKQERVKTIATHLDMLGDNSEAHSSARDITTNMLMAYFEYRRKVMPKDGWPEVKEVTLLCEKKDAKAATEGIREGNIIGEETNETRILSNTPGGEMTPATLADAARRAGKKHGVRVTIFDEKKMKALGFGGVLGVGKGSDIPPCFIVMEYRHGGKQKPLVLVGKGVTFDTGGLNLKPSEGIYEMHLDMSGGAAVIHAVSAIARLKLPLNVVGLVPAVENMPSGSSYHPGDLLKTYSGKTIEVLNTDAEGRVILADALAYAKKFNPLLVVDIATLTGAAMGALGQRVSALFTQNQKLEKIFRELGTQSGDEMWPLPLWDEYDADIQATFGDIANIAKTKYGGAITAASFLKQFVDGYPWVHLDIAPTMTTIESQHLAKGASGVGVRFFVELAKHIVKNGISV
ncbi:MAG: leucyl aminopeptidase [bacterium]|nr:leucyl aminopeptidase [bacterium]